MKVTIHSEQHITLSGFAEPGFDVVSEHPDAGFGALQMFHASLGLCTFSVLDSYGEQIEAKVSDLVIDLSWRYAEDPFRIGAIDMRIRWPELPESRLRAAQRAAALCTIHNTLHHPPQVDTRVTR